MGKKLTFDSHTSKMRKSKQKRQPTFADCPVKKIKIGFKTFKEPLARDLIIGSYSLFLRGRYCNYNHVLCQDHSIIYVNLNEALKNSPHRCISAYLQDPP